MKKFAMLPLFLSLLAVAGSSCSDDDSDPGKTPDSTDKPSVMLLNTAISQNTLTTTIAPKNAAECSYVCYPEDSNLFSDEEILASGTSVAATTSTTVTFEDLEYETPYIIAVAVRDQAGATSSTSLTLVTGKSPYASAGEPANTYIVSEAGAYSFDTKKVSGAQIENIAKVDWIWATKINQSDTQQRLVSDISYADGKVTFQASGERGNAVLAAFDASNTIRWVWLIWCTDQPGTMQFSSGSIFQDRVLGATGATKESGSKAWGTILYQWGRNVPIFGGYEDEYDSKGETFNEARKWTIMNPTYGLEWKFVEGVTSLEGSFANPTTFYTDMIKDQQNKDIRHWHDSDDRNLWKEGSKTDYDPCPAGYRLPQPEDWGDALSKIVPASDLSGGTYTYNGQTAWFPVSGCGRSYDTAENIRGMGSQFMLWNGRISYENDFGPGGPAQFDRYYPSRTIVGLEGSIIETDAMANRTFAHATRCVQIQ